MEIRPTTTYCFAQTTCPYVCNLEYSPDSLLLTVSNTDKINSILDIHTFTVKNAMSFSHPIHTVKYTNPYSVLTFTSKSVVHSDVRTNAHSAEISLKNECISGDLSPNQTLFACGDTKGSVFLYDTRDTSRVLEEITLHTNEVTQCKFHPHVSSLLLTSSIDDMINKLNLSNLQDEEELLDNVYNTGQSTHRLGFFGPASEFIYSATEVESLSLWSLAEDEKINDWSRETLFGEVNRQCGGDFEYIIDCSYAENGFLNVFVGNHSGTLGKCTLSRDAIQVTSLLHMGHSDTVREVCRIQDNVYVSGGEDGRIALWNV